MRPQRFDLNLPVWYRSTDETHWHTGVTEIVSSTGALIRAEEPAAPTQQVRVVIELPSMAGCLIGSGRIVPPEETHCPAGTFAIAVGHFHIRSKAVLNRLT